MADISTLDALSTREGTHASLEHDLPLIAFSNLSARVALSSESLFIFSQLAFHLISVAHKHSVFLVYIVKYRRIFSAVSLRIYNCERSFVCFFGSSTNLF
jgi:hypothetical protein